MRLRWTKFLPRVGDLFILEYHRGRRVGVFVKKQLKNYYDAERSFGIVWTIMWIPVGDEKMPSPQLSEITIMNYLRSGKGKTFRSDDGIYD